MTKMEKLLYRKRKLEEYYKTLPTAESVDGFGTELSIAQEVVAEEYKKVEREIAKEELEEFLNADENFKKVVLDDNNDR